MTGGRKRKKNRFANEDGSHHIAGRQIANTREAAKSKPQGILPYSQCNFSLFHLTEFRCFSLLDFSQYTIFFFTHNLFCVSWILGFSVLPLAINCYLMIHFQLCTTI